MLTREDVHELIDNMPEGEFSALQAFLRASGLERNESVETANDSRSLHPTLLDAIADAQVAATRATIEHGPKAINLREFVERSKSIPQPDDEFLDDLTDVRRNQGRVEPIDWP